MGNTVQSTKGAMSIADAKHQISKTFSGESEKSSSQVRENPKTRREKNKRHKERQKE